jgi:hypothetical protein
MVILKWPQPVINKSNFLGLVGREGPSNWGEKNKINAK